MSETREHLPNDPPDELPPKLAGHLAALYGTPPAIPASADASLRAAIHLHFQRQAARRRRLRLVLGWGSGIAAAAAVVVLALRLIPTAGTGPGPQQLSIHSPTDPLDLNGDGKVDILDAFFLARQLKSGGATDPKWDVNGDGVVDQRDVDAIAARAVALERRGVQ